MRAGQCIQAFLGGPDTVLFLRNSVFWYYTALKMTNIEWFRGGRNQIKGTFGVREVYFIFQGFMPNRLKRNHAEGIKWNRYSSLPQWVLQTAISKTSSSEYL